MCGSRIDSRINAAHHGSDDLARSFVRQHALYLVAEA